MFSVLAEYILIVLCGTCPVHMHTHMCDSVQVFSSLISGFTYLNVRLWYFFVFVVYEIACILH